MLLHLLTSARVRLVLFFRLQLGHLFTFVFGRIYVTVNNGCHMSDIINSILYIVRETLVDFLYLIYAMAA